MSLDSPAARTREPGVTAAPGRPETPLKQLRALKRQGLAGQARTVRALLGQVDDVLDLESAGAVLGGRTQREQLAVSGEFAEQRIALLGSSTMDSLPHLLTAALIRDGVLPEIRLAGFNQWRFQILAGAPDLRDLDPRVAACLLDDSAVFEGVADPLDIAEVEARCAVFPEELAQWTRASRETLGGLTVLCTVPLSPLRRDRIVDYRTKARLEAAWHRMNAAILDLATGQPGTVVLSHAGIAEHAGVTFGSERMRHVAAHVYAPEFLRAYAEELARVARADLGRTAKCLVLDLDNTLWGGVVGDDGVGALRLGGAYPGSAHLELQSLARDLMRQGVMLSVASKNDDEIAREAFATHPEMLLDLSSFVGFRANWNPKPDNLRELAAELNIGLDAMVFADDNPVERGLMRELLPQVTTVELPSDPAVYASLIAARGDFNLLKVTDEDRGRTRMYQARARRTELESTAGNLEDYLDALGSELTVEPAGPLNTARIVQLFGKTNQFNLTGRRYSEDEVAERRADGTGAFFAARLTDRYGDNGLIAALALAEEDDGAWSIENFVLSCRVFSRDVEGAIAGLVLRSARAHGAPAVTARFTRSAKNAKFADFYRGLGFAPAPVPVPEPAPVPEPVLEQGDARSESWRHDLTAIAELPRWIGVTDDQGAFHVR
ncbi:HAD-IIIC family phosphatase [Streptomyces sp. NPDC051569]|uniref:HAD-IIIC family phosphatase n=1 Tax=Streptomyces sp. NPDC051569 TaxID=3365661 RepID=UPI00378E5404